MLAEIARHTSVNIREFSQYCATTGHNKGHSVYDPARSNPIYPDIVFTGLNMPVLLPGCFQRFKVIVCLHPTATSSYVLTNHGNSLVATIHSVCSYPARTVNHNILYEQPTGHHVKDYICKLAKYLVCSYSDHVVLDTPKSKICSPGWQHMFGGNSNT
jgi:hypothetical protein